MKNLKGLLHGLLVWFLFSGSVMAIEEPQYQVLKADEAFEIRQYGPTLVAETIVDGDMDEASNRGFRLIADYIFGNNQIPDSQVTVEPQSSKIAMTAPVTVEPQSGDRDMISAQRWRVQFVMPSQYTLATIPKPRNGAVVLREVPGKCFVVHQYSGFNSLSRVQQKTDETLAWAKQQSLTIIGIPQLSRYNPPWTLPMFRRNEIWIEIAKP